LSHWHAATKTAKGAEGAHAKGAGRLQLHDLRLLLLLQQQLLLSHRLLLAQYLLV
jgi:hypothetical protein